MPCVSLLRTPYSSGLNEYRFLERFHITVCHIAAYIQYIKS